MLRQPHRKRRPARIHLRMWLAYILMLLIVVGIDSCGRYTYRRKLDAHQKAEAALERKKSEVLAPVAKLIPDPYASQPAGFELRHPLLIEFKRFIVSNLPSRNRGVSSETVEKILNNGQPFVTRETARHNTYFYPYPYENGSITEEMASYTPPDGSITLNLYFQDGYYSHAELVGPTLEYPKPWPWWSNIERHASVILKHALKAWILLLAAAIVFARYRWLAAELALMISITILIGDLPSPVAYYNNTKMKLGSQIPWDITIIALSLTMLSPNCGTAVHSGCTCWRRMYRFRNKRRGRLAYESLLANSRQEVSWLGRFRPFITDFKNSSRISVAPLSNALCFVRCRFTSWIRFRNYVRRSSRP